MKIFCSSAYLQHILANIFVCLEKFEPVTGILKDEKKLVVALSYGVNMCINLYIQNNVDKCRYTSRIECDTCLSFIVLMQNVDLHSSAILVFLSYCLHIHKDVKEKILCSTRPVYSIQTVHSFKSEHFLWNKGLLLVLLIMEQSPVVCKIEICTSQFVYAC